MFSFFKKNKERELESLVNGFADSLYNLWYMYNMLLFTLTKINKDAKYYFIENFDKIIKNEDSYDPSNRKQHVARQYLFLFILIFASKESERCVFNTQDDKKYTYIMDKFVGFMRIMFMQRNVLLDDELFPTIFSCYLEFLKEYYPDEHSLSSEEFKDVISNIPSGNINISYAFIDLSIYVNQIKLTNN